MLVWKDRWLHKDDHDYVQSPVVDGLENLTMSSIIKAHNTWDVDLINSLFMETDKQNILSLPLSSNVSCDVVYWKQERTRVYFVKSTYRVLQHELANQTPEEERKVWLFLWRMHLPPKIKNFIWRACTDCLPMLELLRKRGF